MSKPPKTVFVCQECGSQSPKWLGRCGDCGAWNSFVEERPQEAAAAGAGGQHRYASSAASSPARLYADIQIEDHARVPTGIGEFDRVLGGGIVPGSLVLLGGSPGIGKSTLTGMAMGHLAAAGRSTLYVSGEESASQIRLRAERLGAAALDVPVLAETDLDTVLDVLRAERPAACVID